jgi:hypothetical protein
VQYTSDKSAAAFPSLRSNELVSKCWGEYLDLNGRRSNWLEKAVHRVVPEFVLFAKYERHKMKKVERLGHVAHGRNEKCIQDFRSQNL